MHDRRKKIKDLIYKKIPCTACSYTLAKARGCCACSMKRRGSATPSAPGRILSQRSPGQHRRKGVSAEININLMC